MAGAFITASLSAASLGAPGAGGGPRRFLFFVRVLEYKGVDDQKTIAEIISVLGAVARPDELGRLVRAP
jgi:hypothetical protein